MITVDIPKEIKSVRAKVAFNLTGRQLLSFFFAGVVGIPIFFVSKGYVGNDIATFLLIITAFPILLVGLYEREDGLTLEKRFKYMRRYMARCKKRVYRSPADQNEINRAYATYQQFHSTAPKKMKNKDKRREKGNGV